MPRSIFPTLLTALSAFSGGQSRSSLNGLDPRLTQSGGDLSSLLGGSTLGLGGQSIDQLALLGTQFPGQTGGLTLGQGITPGFNPNASILGGQTFGIPGAGLPGSSLGLTGLTGGGTFDPNQLALATLTGQVSPLTGGLGSLGGLTGDPGLANLQFQQALGRVFGGGGPNSQAVGNLLAGVGSINTNTVLASAENAANQLIAAQGGVPSNPLTGRPLAGLPGQQSLAGLGQVGQQPGGSGGALSGILNNPFIGQIAAANPSMATFLGSLNSTLSRGLSTSTDRLPGEPEEQYLARVAQQNGNTFIGRTLAGIVNSQGLSGATASSAQQQDPRAQQAANILQAFNSGVLSGTELDQRLEAAGLSREEAQQLADQSQSSARRAGNSSFLQSQAFASTPGVGTRV